MKRLIAHLLYFIASLLIETKGPSSSSSSPLLATDVVNHVVKVEYYDESL